MNAVEAEYGFQIVQPNAPSDLKPPMRVYVRRPDGEWGWEPVQTVTPGDSSLNNYLVCGEHIGMFRAGAVFAAPIEAPEGTNLVPCDHRTFPKRGWIRVENGKVVELACDYDASVVQHYLASGACFFKPVAEMGHLDTSKASAVSDLLKTFDLPEAVEDDDDDELLKYQWRYIFKGPGVECWVPVRAEIASALLRDAGFRPVVVAPDEALSLRWYNEDNEILRVTAIQVRCGS